MPTGGRDDVTLLGFGDTVLFRLRGASFRYGEDEPLRPGRVDRPVRLVLDLVPARCDPHALAEDKVGTLFPVHVRADGLGPDASYDLPLDDGTRAELRGFWSTYCTG